MTEEKKSTEEAETAVEEAETAVEEAETAVEEAETAVEETETAVEETETAVEETENKKKSKSEPEKPRIAKVSDNSKKILSYLKLNEMFYKAIITLYRYYTGYGKKSAPMNFHEHVLTDIEKRVFLFIKKKYTIVTPDFILVLRYFMLVFYRIFSPLREKHYLMKDVTLDLRESSWFYYLELRERKSSQEQNFIFFTKLLETLDFSPEESEVLKKGILFLQCNFPDNTAIINNPHYKKIEIILILEKYLETLQKKEVPENLFDEGKGTDVEEVAYARDKLMTLIWDDLIHDCSRKIKDKFHRDNRGLFWRLTDEDVVEIAANGKHTFLIEYILLKICDVLTVIPHNSAITLQFFLYIMVQAAVIDGYSYKTLLHKVCIQLSEKKYFDYLISKCLLEKSKMVEVSERITKYNKEQISVDPVTHRRLYYLFYYADEILHNLSDVLKENKDKHISFKFSKPLILLHYMLLNLNSFFNLKGSIGCPKGKIGKYFQIIDPEVKVLPRVKVEDYEKFMQEHFFQDLSIKEYFS